MRTKLTNTELIQKIKAEIDKLYGEYKDKFYQCGDQYHLGLIDGLDMAERVLDTLESEKPMELEEEIKSWIPPIKVKVDEDVRGIMKHIREWGELIARHFAQWGAEHSGSAVEGEVQMKYNGGLCAKTIRPINEDMFRLGDKVRIIILKED